MNIIAFFAAVAVVSTNNVADLGTVLVEGSALSKYRPEKVEGGTFTGEAPENLPCVVDTLTEDFIREKNPTDLNDLLRWIPGVETGGTSLLVRQPGLFSVRGMGGTEPALDGVIPVGRGAGLFLDPAMMERVEVVKGPMASLTGGAGAQQNNNGAGGSINMYLKGAHLRDSERLFSEQTSVGRNTWRQRAMVDANEVIVDDKFAIRLPAAFDIYSPAYANCGEQDGARPREQYTVAPSFVWKPSDKVSFGVKTLFVSSDSPSYIGIPMWNGRPAGGFSWHESSCRKDDRSKYMGMMVNPWLDWQVTDDWLLKFGGAFIYSHMEQSSREPYTGTGAELTEFLRTGLWSSGNKYQVTNFSESRLFQKSFNLYVRSVYTKEDLPWGLGNTFLVQPDYYYRDSSGSFGIPTSRYGVSFQDSVRWKWVSLLAGVRYDHFEESSGLGKVTINHIGRDVNFPSAAVDAWSPRVGLTVKPLDWLVFFANCSETVTPTLGYYTVDGRRPEDPWTAMQYEGGFRVCPVEALWLSASYYHIDQKNMPRMESDYTAYYFDGHNSSEGVELSLAGDITKNWTVMAMYNYNFYEDHTKTGKAREFARTPRNVISLNTSYRLHGWEWVEDVVVSLGYRYKSMAYGCMRGTYQHEEFHWNASHVFDVNVTIPFLKFGGPEGWYLTLGIRNLFNENYIDTSRHWYECFVGDPRTFEIGIRGKF